ncbi:hypothetical protein I553_4940 [Mycobacterium xenopi 4042]|uniref:Uncharacterized protein n=1 Tax=Mycobacterium xenopi 4042 TaxID=1299334 RepID=X8AI22_MYCXE|nr:hypothetical protein I553_4940 [Mycobacterium xenopi 4042]
MEPRGRHLGDGEMKAFAKRYRAAERLFPQTLEDKLSRNDWETGSNGLGLNQGTRPDRRGMRKRISRRFTASGTSILVCVHTDAAQWAWTFGEPAAGLKSCGRRKARRQ